jgi:hypothetical protein
MMTHTNILNPEGGFTSLEDIRVSETNMTFCGMEQTMIREGPGGGCTPGISQVILWHRTDDNPCRTGGSISWNPG